MERLRGPRPPLDPRRPAGWLLETEIDGSGREQPTLTIFVTNRECPWRCVYCDLWKHTLDHSTEPGDVPAQVSAALREAETGGASPRWIKLYNAGSFFDPRAIPVADHGALAGLVAGFDRVVVECHPALVGPRVERFLGLLGDAAEQSGRIRRPVLEVAMGLESVNPAVYPRLNKQVTPDSFARAAGRLHAWDVGVRAFVLVRPPFEAPGEAAGWAARAASFAAEAGARVVSLIPVRPGNGALETLRDRGEFEPPRLADLEDALACALGRVAGQAWVEADLWDLEQFSDCAVCHPARRLRLARMNRMQCWLPAVDCPRCGGGRSVESHRHP